MGSVNPVVLYYDILLMVSLLLTGIYLFKWHKHYDAHITLVFMLVPVICLGYVMLAHSTVLTAKPSVFRNRPAFPARMSHSVQTASSTISCRKQPPM